jgi:predicted MPP superfamily phosphohydrolase
MKHNFISPWKHITQKKYIKLNIPKFPCSDYTIVNLSDIHLGYYLDKSFLENLVKDVIDISPNICVITGDLISYNINLDIEILSPLKYLTQQIPTYFVVGNHEIGLYRSNIREFLDKLNILGVHTLFNQSTIIMQSKCIFNLVGVGDFIGERFGVPMDIEKSFRDIDINLATIVLIHRPNSIRFFQGYPFVLSLSGHNHGGQITKLGLLSSVIRNQGKFLIGLKEIEEGKFVYVSNGIGYSRIPFRLFAPSQIDVIKINNS